MSYEKFFKAAQKNAQPGKPVSASGKGKAKGRSGSSRVGTTGVASFALKNETNGSAKKRLARAAEDTPEKRLRAELAQRLQAKQRARRANRPKPPKLAISVLVVSLAACAGAYFYGDETEALINRVTAKYEITLFGQASAAEDKPAKAGADKNAKAAKPASKEGQEKSAASDESAAKSSGTKGEGDDKEASQPTPNIKQWTPEELSFFTKLDDRKKELDFREAELNKLDEELHKRETELEAKLKNLEAMRTEISKTLKDRVAADQEKVDKLVQFYSTMKAPQAAKIIESLNEDLAVEVLDKMKKKSAAEIMDAMDAKKARRLSELLTGYERTTASTTDEGKGN